MRGFFRKPNPWRLAALLLILAVCLAVLVQKRRTESALVAGSPPLVAAVWGLGVFLPPGDGDPATAPRTLSAELEPGRRLSAELVFGDPQRPWPTRLSVARSPGPAGSGGPRVLEIRFTKGAPEFIAPSEHPPLTAGEEKELAADLERLTERLNQTWPRAGSVKWRKVEPGLEEAVVHSRYGVRLGPREMYLARLDPEQYSFQPWHEREFQILTEAEAMDITAWSRRLPWAALLINGGQYERDRGYIGRLVRDGRPLSSRSKKQWKGYLVSDPGPEAPAGAPRATILDLELPSGGLRPDQYQNIMQSLMLLDRQGRVRVNNSYYLASRAAIARDRAGRILFIAVPGAIGLHDLAMLLKDPALELVDVLCLDGGFEAQMFLRRGPEGPPLTVKAEYLVFPGETLYVPTMHRTLPSVITARRR